MLFPEEDAAQLKTWIVKRIENTSDADSDVLADYVIALLKHDGDQAAVRKLCEEEIPDFLTEDPKAFLDDVFQAITNKSYMPGAPPAPKPNANTDTTSNLPPRPPNLRKRGLDDDDDFREYDGYPQQGERAYKQPRRGGRRNGGFGGYMPPGGMANMPRFDPNNPMEALMTMQAMGMPFPNMPDYGGQGAANRQRRRGRCRDFDNKGYCSRGSTCAYDHSQEPIYSDGPGDYDMGDGGMDMGQMFSRGPQFFGDSHRGGRGRGGKKNRGGRSSKNSRASFSADGPVNDKSKSTIVVENIPETNLSEEDVNGFFMQFGKIETMHVVPEKQLAVITYDSWDAANKAYQSPDVIFNNRFVKVFWHRRETEKSGGRGPRAGQNAHGDNESQADEIDAEEFQRRQEEAQKLHLERESQRTELEQKRQELEKQQQELLAKHRAETERLQTKLMAKSGGGSEGTGATDENGTPTGSTDMLRARLALLEQEAKILGIDPENPSPEDDGSTGGFRGGYRGRGYRARGTGRGGYAPRGRGSFRGNGARHAAYAQYSIDNRPKKVAIAGVDFSAPEKDEALRAFLISNGEFESVDSGSGKTTVSFPDRKTAEKFYFTLQGKELPGIPGNLELSWINTPLPPVPVAAAASSSNGPSTADKAAAEPEGLGEDFGAMGDVGEETGGASGSRQDDAPREVNMDYEMPDEEAW